MTTPSNIPNPSNPFDSAGADHNAGLDYVAANFGSPTKPLGTSLQTLVANFGVSYFSLNFDDTYNSLGTIAAAQQTYLTNNNDYIPNVIANIISDWSGSSAAKSYLTDITNAILEYTDSSQIDTLVSSIKTIETAILADGHLTNEESELLLCSSSIARYSSYYWFNVYNNRPTNWPTDPGTNAGPFWDWLNSFWGHVTKAACVDVGTWTTVALTVPGAGGNPLIITACVLISCGSM
ncbi:MAG: hypothetical protein WCO28_13460 [Bacteroidota bacterium]